MNKDDMKQRTKRFALRVIHLVESLSKGRTEDVLGKQLLRSGTVGWIKRSESTFLPYQVLYHHAFVNYWWIRPVGLNPPYTAPD